MQALSNYAALAAPAASVDASHANAIAPADLEIRAKMTCDVFLKHAIFLISGNMGVL